MSPWFLAIRPKTLPVAVAPILIGSALAHQDFEFSWTYFAMTLFAALLIQIGTNLANDYYDFVQGADTSERIGPVRVTQAGLMAPRTVRLGFLICFALATFLGMGLVARAGWPILVIGIVSIASGILYTAGPYALAYLGLGDLFVLVFFGPVSVMGTYYVQTLHWGASSGFWHGIAIGLLAVAILVVNNLRDVEQDRKANKRTLVVRFGRGFAHAQYLFCLLAPALIELWLGFWPCTILLLAGIFWLRKASIHQLLPRTAALLFAFALLIVWCFQTGSP